MDWLVLKEKFYHLWAKYRYVILVLLVGLVLMLLPSKQSNTEVTQVMESKTETKQDIREELTDILSQIEGVGEVKVMLTVASGEETVYQSDTEISNTTNRIETVIITDENRKEIGLIQKVNPPKYMGAIIVCKGGANVAVKLAVVEAVSRVTGLGADQISVLKMK